MHDLTGFQRDLMRVVASEAGTHGLGVKEELEDYYTGEIHHGRLYPNLDALVNKGLVEKTEKDRRTNAYHLTSRGKRELEERDKWNAAHTPATVSDVDEATAPADD